MSTPDKLTIVYEKVAEFEAQVVKTSGKYAIILPKRLGEKLWGKRFRIVLYQEVK